VLSYLQLGGVCATCGSRIDRVHLWGELTGAVVGATIAATLPGPSALLTGGLAGLLLAAAVADLRTLRLPETLSIGVALAGAGLAWLHGGWPALALGLITAAATFAVLVGVREFSARMRGRQSLGLGDVKLLAALAVWLGVATPWAVVVGSVLGLAGMALLRPADGRLPFGPYIAVAAWLVGLGGEWGWWPTTL
jgi:leader peptidase (prepilin peptidase)/N-methyltransferase